MPGSRTCVLAAFLLVLCTRAEADVPSLSPADDDALCALTCERGARRDDFGCCAPTRARPSRRTPEAVYAEAVRACERDLPRCTEAATMLLDGRGVDRDTDRGVRELQRGCASLGRASNEACRRLWLALSRGIALPTDAPSSDGMRGVEPSTARLPPRQRAFEEMRSLCERDGYVRACVSLGAMYETANGTSQDLTRAYALYRQGCEAGLPAACTASRAILELAEDGG